jgi:hypothetical protein
MRRLLVMSAVLAVGGGLLAAEGGGQSSVQVSPATSYTSDAPPSSAVADFAILGRERTASDAIDSFTPGGLIYGADASESRRTETRAGSFGFWVVPGRDGMCLVAFSPKDGGGAACSSYSQVETDHGSLMTVGSSAHSSLPAGDVAIFGLVPNGTSQVNVQFASGKSRAVPARENAFAVIVSGSPTAATYSDASGAQKLGIVTCGTGDCDTAVQPAPRGSHP